MNYEITADYNPIVTYIELLPTGYNPSKLGLPNNDCFKCAKLDSQCKWNRIKETCPFQDDSMCPYNESNWPE